MKKNDRQRFLVSSVLLGLSAGLSVLPMPNVAHAQTLNEYKADLAQRYPAYQAVLDREAAIESKAQGETIIASTGDFDENGRNRAKHITPPDCRQKCRPGKPGRQRDILHYFVYLTGSSLSNQSTVPFYFRIYG